MHFFNKAIIEKYFCSRCPPALVENWKTRFADAVKSWEFLKLDFLSSGSWTFQYRKLFSVSIVFNLELLGVLLDVFISRWAVDLFRHYYSCPVEVQKAINVTKYGCAKREGEM